MKNILFFSIFISLLFSCGDSNKKRNDYMPVLSFLLSQAKHIDTSVEYTIIKITTNGTVQDTIYLKREEFRGAAKDFLTIPDITEGRYTDNYTETKTADDLLNNVVFSYSPKKEDQEIRRQEVTVKPGGGNDGEDKIEYIYIETKRKENGNNIIKRMLWNTDESFKIATITENKNGTESINREEVVWNRQAENW